MSEHQERVAELFAEAVELETQGRNSYLDKECHGDLSLLAEVKSLLALNEQASKFMESPALEVEARHLADERGEEETHTGQLISHYEILSLIGEGGMGEVYLARDRELNRKVAIKLIKGNFKSKEILRRFQNEREILAGLQHANIARLLDGGTTDDGLPFFVMEYVEGMPIGQYCDSQRLTIEERLKLFRSVCSAVQFAHQHLTVHRDLKPSNILITEDGMPKLLDFGIAKVLQTEGLEATPETATELRVMTPEYSSPEQARGEAITTASDVYSLGVLLYELLTGRRPYQMSSRSPLEIARVICESKPEHPSTAISRNEEISTSKEDGRLTLTPESISQRRDTQPEKLRRRLSGDLDNIVLKALRKEPQRRYASVEQLSEDIRRHLEGLPVIARRDTFSYRSSKFVKRHQVGVAASVVAFLLLIAGITAIVWEAHAAQVQRARAEQQFNDLRELAHSVLFDYHDAIATLPGSTSVRERLVKDSLKYLDRLAQEAGNDLSLQRELAIAYLKVGDVQGRPATANLGDARGALESYQKALAISEKMIVQAPKNMEILTALALSHERLGEINTLSGSPANAVEQYRQSLATFEELNAADPSDPVYQAELAFTHRMLGQVLGVPSVANIGDTKGALEHLQQAAAIYEALPDQDFSADVKKHTELLGTAISKKLRQESLADVFDEIATVLDVMGNKAEALENRQKSVSRLETLLAGDQQNTNIRRNLAVEYGNIGNALLNVGDKEKALARNQQALALYEALAREDPNNLNAQKDLALGYRNMGKTLADSKDSTGAFSYYHKAIVILEALVAKDQNNAFLRRHLAYTYLRISMLLSDSGNLNGAVDQARQAISICESLIAADPQNSTARNTLALSYSQLGRSYSLLALKAGAISQQKKNWQEAKNWYQKSLAIWQEMRNNGTLSNADSSKPDEVVREIAKCDAALSR